MNNKTDVLDLAEYILYFRDYKYPEKKDIANIDLNLILYFIECEGILNNDIEIDDKIYAGIHGPYIPRVFGEYKKYGDKNIPRTKKISEANLIKFKKLDSLIADLLSHDTYELVQLATKDNTPWAYASVNPKNHEITGDMIKKCYREKDDNLSTKDDTKVDDNNRRKARLVMTILASAYVASALTYNIKDKAQTKSIINNHDDASKYYDLDIENNHVKKEYNKDNILVLIDKNSGKAKSYLVQKKVAMINPSNDKKREYGIDDYTLDKDDLSSDIIVELYDLNGEKLVSYIDNTGKKKIAYNKNLYSDLIDTNYQVPFNKLDDEGIKTKESYTLEEIQKVERELEDKFKRDIKTKTLKK